MPAIITKSNKTNQAVHFVDFYKTSNVLYYGIGRSTPWTNEVNPPAALVATSEETAAYDALEGAHKVDPKDIVPVVPRKTWTVGTEYVTKDLAIANTQATNFYVVTSNAEVYMCESKDLTGSTYANPPLSVNEPTGTGIVNTSDGYTWKFLYDLSIYDSSTLLSTNWLPVNYADHISTLQTSSGDIHAAKTLDCNACLVRGSISDIALNTNITYRQVTIISNPLASDGVTLASAVDYTKPVDPTFPEWTLYSGDILYIDNRSPITRTFGQNEEMYTVIEF